MSTEDEIPLPSEPVLSEEETSRQLKRDYCRKYADEVVRLTTENAALKKSLEAKVIECDAMRHDLSASNQNRDAAREKEGGR